MRRRAAYNMNVCQPTVTTRAAIKIRTVEIIRAFRQKPHHIKRDIAIAHNHNLIAKFWCQAPDRLDDRSKSGSPHQIRRHHGSLCHRPAPGGDLQTSQWPRTTTSNMSRNSATLRSARIVISDRIDIAGKVSHPAFQTVGQTVG